MNLLKREFTIKISWLLDNLIPPILRDWAPFTYLPQRILFGKHREAINAFKRDVWRYTRSDYEAFYRSVGDAAENRETDLTQTCIDKLLSYVEGESVLDVGCGKGYLCYSLWKAGLKQIVGADFQLRHSHYFSAERRDRLTFVELRGDVLPFGDDSIDTVISTHTLEHVLRPHAYIAELRRVARRRLIIVVPKQREYRYTFDAHINYFPYEESLLRLMDNCHGECETVGGDLFYYEDEDNA